MKIFVVDDHSSDGTADRAREAFNDVVIVVAKPLPAEWTGKMWAVSQGLHQALRLAREDLDSTITFHELMKFNVLRTVK